uniref:HNH nuclease domain-containing protein n=1 Tax=Florenciella sp. virus SA2 TaxID=3240092 RepID=A0AB39JEB8_9VIRU|tara:strand:- start:218 stop:808 length:591 start_codon:yes stop_codon:yes gene_type:complete
MKEENEFEDYELLRCNYGTGKKQCVYSKISTIDDIYINNLHITWYYWKGGKSGGGYIRGHYKGKCIYLHDLIMRRIEDKPGENYSVDHINQDKLDNRRENLRWATQSEQNSNRGKSYRKHNAKPLPDGITQDMLEKYVVYYKECYNKEKDKWREFFKVEKHPNLDKIWIGSKSNKVSILDKLSAANKVAVAGSVNE